MKKAIAVVVCLLLAACSAGAARRQEISFHNELRLKDEAWIAARIRLASMCGVSICAPRLIKLSNGANLDDWQWLNLPAHTIIVQVHEEELRKRVTLRIYDEYMLAVAYHLAHAIDIGEITPEQHKALFNYAWNWMFEKTKSEAVLLRESVIKAEQADARLRQIFANIGLALAAGLSAYGQAYAQSYRAPTSCFGTGIGYTYSFTCR